MKDVVKELLLKKMNGELTEEYWKEFIESHIMIDEILDTFQKEIPWKYVFENHYITSQQWKKYKNNFTDDDWMNVSKY